jgi:poly-gamma-glutamate synthesis protein (capsule biosynthesis protein)
MEARQLADFVMFSVHAHEPGNWSDEPADFLRLLARKAIDSGASVVVGHGPHRLRGIEIYRGYPIFYSLGNFIFQLDMASPLVNDSVEQYKTDLGASDTEVQALCNALSFRGDVWYESLIAIMRFDKGGVAEVRLVPITITPSGCDATSGLPQLASQSIGQRILERIKELSHRFGTQVNVERGVGIIRRPFLKSSASNS